MRVAGIGFRRDASVSSLQAALDAAGGSYGLHALAVHRAKARMPCLQMFAGLLGLMVIAIEPAALAQIATLTDSERIRRMHGVGSIAEAVALVACGPDSRLIGPRAVSPDRMATAAIAVSGVDAGETS